MHAGRWRLDILADLNEAQRQAVTHVDGPLLVLAGAGSGKTRVITRRAAYLITQGVDPDHVLALTFTNKAAGEMRERIEALNAPPGVTCCTFHSLCARLLREFAAEADLSHSYTIYDRDDQVRLVKEALGRLDLPSDRLSPASVHAAISNAKNELKGAAAFAAEARSVRARQIAKVFGEYERLLTANRALDFDDLLLRMVLLLRDRPDLRELLGRRYRYVLIDEYQDTNHAQYLLAHGIALDHNNLCVTGDPDQSIYGWRGANIRNILEFESDYPDAVVVRLEENYRSTPSILAAASRLIAQNARRKKKALWTRRQAGAEVRIVTCDTGRAEAAELARRVEAHRDAGGDLNDLAVFYRVNALSRTVEETFLQRGIPYRVARGVAFYGRKEIKDVLAYLRVLVNPADDLSCRRIINTPARGIGAKSIARLDAMAQRAGGGLLAACRRAEEAGLGGKAAGSAAGFARMVDELAGELDRPVRDIVEDVVQRSGLEEALSGDDEEARQVRGNVDELITTAGEFDRASGGSLADYLYLVSLVADVDHLDGAGGGAVTLMTLHAAKGLEFPAVFMIGCEEGLLPFQRPEQPGEADDARRQQDMEEERRLAFVGMTRAKDELTLLCAKHRMLRGKLRPMAASRFLAELHGEGVRVDDVTSHDVPRSLRRGRRRRGGFYRDADQREAIEAMEDARGRGAEGALAAAESAGWNEGEPDDEAAAPPPEYQYLTAGCRVMHERFGRGEVVRLSRPWPETRAEVLFEDLGPKTLKLAQTSLELLDGE